MKRKNGYLVGGCGLPMKYVRAENAAEARRAWRLLVKQDGVPAVSQVTNRKRPRQRQKRMGGEE